MSRRGVGKLSQSGRRPNGFDLALAWNVDDEIVSQIIPAFDAWPEALVRRAGAATAAAPASAPSCSRSGLVLSGRCNENNNVVFGRERHRRRHLWGHAVPRPGGAKSQLIATKRGLDVFLI